MPLILESSILNSPNNKMAIISLKPFSYSIYYRDSNYRLSILRIFCGYSLITTNYLRYILSKDLYRLFFNYNLDNYSLIYNNTKDLRVLMYVLTYLQRSGFIQTFTKKFTQENSLMIFKIFKEYDTKSFLGYCLNTI